MTIQELPKNTSTMVTRARSSPNEQDCMALYERWAATYNHDLGASSQDYIAPILVAKSVLSTSSANHQGLILDAGCGTGLVGQALAQAGATDIDGLDLSPAMLNEARQTGVYRTLTQADLTKDIEKAAETYDVVTCCGTFTLGHVGPTPALREFVRVTKKEGFIFATILDEIWLSGGFQTEVNKLEAEHIVKVISTELIDYVMARGDKAVLLVLEKVSPL